MSSSNNGDASLPFLFDSRLSMLLRDCKSVAVACSGGPDSMALALLAQDWAKRHGLKLVALTVDHGLRPESAKEARQAGIWLKQLGITHTILAWKGEKPASNIQETARKARYGLLASYCQAHGVEALLVAHTLDDQAETFLLRLKRGSGVDGLSAMEPRVTLYGVEVIRPLLDIAKHRLLAYLKERGQAYLLDPSNENTAYDRVKIRRLMPELAKAGLTAEKLYRTAAAMERAKRSLRGAAQLFFVEHGRLFPEGYALLDALPEDEEIALRILARLCMLISGDDTPPRLDGLTHLLSRIRRPGFKPLTLGGCLWKGYAGNILVFRETAALPPPVAVTAGQALLWDGRFTVTVPEQRLKKFLLSELGQQGWLAVAGSLKLRTAYPDKRILYALPCLRSSSGKIVAIPHLGIGKGKAFFPDSLFGPYTHCM